MGDSLKPVDRPAVEDPAGRGKRCLDPRGQLRVREGMRMPSRAVRRLSANSGRTVTVAAVPRAVLPGHRPRPGRESGTRTVRAPEGEARPVRPPVPGARKPGAQPPHRWHDVS
ncbi:hypothetical protein Kpho02_54760 [Kitasatospora phosalacinea]|uniref:Uncharacterized protein n=1 Tax=Kitasatospora phosalacinea TaxID=2065 RepID=A0A9W6QAH0_9ACTN|nr:hypothetical protein Kpho02_54760 [Kitasatospora phosalacinea]